MGETDLISRQAAVDTLNVGAELLRRVLDDTDIVGAERAKFEWGLELIESCISDMKELPSAYPERCECCETLSKTQLLIPQPEQRWIPCSERLPEKKRKTYWVCTDTEYQCECRWTNNRYGIGESDNWGWSYFDVPQYTEVIAWMPLPEPYKEEQE